MLERGRCLVHPQRGQGGLAGHEESAGPIAGGGDRGDRGEHGGVLEVASAGCRGRSLHDEPDLLWFATGVPDGSLNGVIHSQFADGEAASRIDETVGYFERRPAADAVVGRAVVAAGGPGGTAGGPRIDCQGRGVRRGWRWTWTGCRAWRRRPA